MRSPSEEVASHLCCPDDQESLRAVSGALSCSQCDRIFPFQEGMILELLPRAPAEPGPNAEYAAAYHSLFHQTFENQESLSLGALKSHRRGGSIASAKDRKSVV